jgi:hypothetical protein
MAFESIEASYIGQQLKDNIGRMVSNMRDNATQYKSDVASARLTVAQVAVIMVADADEFLRRIQLIVDLATRNNTKYQAALTSNGWPGSEVNSLRTTLVGSCDHVKAASLTTQAEIEAEADAILATVPIFERTF